MAHMHKQSVSDLTDSVESSQSGLAHSMSEPIPIPTTCTFTSLMDSDESEDDEPPGVLPFCPLLLPEDIKWRPEFSLAQLHQIATSERCAFERNFEFYTKMSPPSDHDWEEQFSTPVSVSLSEFSPGSTDGQQANSVPLYLSSDLRPSVSQNFSLPKPQVHLPVPS